MELKSLLNENRRTDKTRGKKKTSDGVERKIIKFVKISDESEVLGNGKVAS